MAEPVSITSRDNPLLKELRKVAQDNTAYRKAGRFWVEGDHLCSAALTRGVKPAVAVYSESYWPLAPVEYALPAPELGANVAPQLRAAPAGGCLGVRYFRHSSGSSSKKRLLRL